MGDRGVSTWGTLGGGPMVGFSSERKMGGLLASYMSCESMHVNECIWQVELNDTDYLFF